MLATAATAIVFVLSRHVFPDTPRYIAYCIERGYKPLGVIKGDLSVALALLEAGTVQVIVFAQRTRQVVDEGPTYGLPDRVTASVRPRNQLHMSPRADDVRQAIENTGPLPTGLDPDSIRAARRIWRHFGNHGCA